MSDDTTQPRKGDSAARAAAHFTKAIALLLFGSVVASAGLVVSASGGSSTTWALFVGGIGGLVLALLSVQSMSDGNRCLKE